MMAGMKRLVTERGLSLIGLHFEAVVRALDDDGDGLPYQQILIVYLATRNHRKTAAACDETTADVRHVLERAIEIARDCAKPPEPKSSPPPIRRDPHKHVREGTPILIKHLDAVVEQLDSAPNRQAARVSRRLVLTTFVTTRSQKLTAEACGITRERVRQIVSRAIYRACRLEGVKPPRW